MLVCDDDEAVVEEFSRLLQAHGYRPVGVTDSTTVLEVTRAEQPRVVLLDLLMPGATGAQVLRALRGSPDTHDVPVVVVSGLGPESDESTAQSADGWLLKPVSEERLVRTVANVASGSEPGASVLVVEDDPGLAEVLGTMLHADGLHVVHASTASEAVARGREARPDVVVLDMRLPDGSGADVVKEFRRSGTLAQTSLVVYSAEEIDAGQRHDLELGTTVFMNKGRVSPEELRDRVLRLVSAVTSEVLMSPREEDPDGTGPDGQDRRESARALRSPSDPVGLDISLRTGSGSGRTLLSAFDHALQDAGVADFNLVTLSSVIPPGSRLRHVSNTLPGGHGDLLFCVRAEAYAEHSGDIAWAGLGWCVDETGGGLFVEHHGGSEESVVEQIELSLGDMNAKRGGGYGPVQMALASAHSTGLPACAVVVAAYRVSSWHDDVPADRGAPTMSEPAPAAPRHPALADTVSPTVSRTASPTASRTVSSTTSRVPTGPTTGSWSERARCRTAQASSTRTAVGRP